MKLYRVLMFAAMTSLLPLQQAFCATISNVNVQVIDVDGGTSGILLDRMSASMQVVSNQLFLEKDVDAVAAAEHEYERLLTEIGDRVFTGYELESVDCSIGPSMSITMYARAWSGRIDKPEIDLQFSGVEPETAKLLEERLPTLRGELYTAIKGASYDAGSWAGGILRKIVREHVEKNLPEFKAAVDVVQEGNGTVIQVIIYPVGQLVTEVAYELRSDDIPNILLMDLKYKYQSECNKLRGLPVEYVKTHKDELEEKLELAIAQEQTVKQYNLRPHVTLNPTSKLGISIVLDSGEYKIWFEGYGDIGRDKDNLSGTAHLGKFVSPQDEVFGEGRVYLDDVRWRFGLGYTRYWGKSLWTYRRIMPTGENNYKLEYELSPKWRLRGEFYDADDRKEFGVRYRIHEFLGVEGVYGDDELYLRIIGNL